MTSPPPRLWPKLDLHCHIEGAMRPATLLDFYQREGLYLDEDAASFSRHVQVTGAEESFFDWLPIFDRAMKALKTAEDIRRVTYEAIEDAHAENVIYLELRYAPYFLTSYTSLTPEAVIEAVLAGVNDGAHDFATIIELILIAQQTGGEAEGQAVVDLAKRYDHRAIDIAGDMTKIPLDVFGPIFQRAKAEGLGITVHAGEVAPAHTVQTAVEDLHADRIGHGIRSIEDPGVVNLLLERGTTLEVCVSSNLQTRAAKSFEAHPIHALKEAGVSVTVNTDDPGISNITLTNEYALLLEAGYTQEDFHRFNIAAADAAFTSEDNRTLIKTALNACYSSH